MFFGIALKPPEITEEEGGGALVDAVLKYPKAKRFRQL
jgi:hypothetical protein